MKTYFLSDAHLGAGTDTLQREREIVAFLDSIRLECSRLILLGDMFDFWFSYRHVVPRGFSRFIGKLSQMADEGVEIHYFIGNHDMWVFDYFEREVGCIMHSNPECLLIDGKRFYVGHGDGLGHLDKKYDFLKTIFRCRFNQRLFSFFHPFVGFGIAEAWSESSRRRHKVKSFKYMGDENEGIVLWSKQQLLLEPCDYFVFGHRHLPMMKRLHVETSDGEMRKALYVNTGEWIDHRNYACFDGQDLCLFNGPYRYNIEPQ